MKPSLKPLIEDIVKPKAPGPSTTFTPAHVFFALEMMAEEPIGRNNLARRLEIGEGTVRTIISRLKSRDLVVTSREGCSLTGKGLAVWKRFEELFPERGEIGKTELTNSEYNYAFLVKNSGTNVRS